MEAAISESRGPATLIIMFSRIRLIATTRAMRIIVVVVVVVACRGFLAC